MPVGKRSPEVSVSLHRSLHQRAGRRRVAGMSDSGGSSEPTAKRPPPDGSTQLPAGTSRATGEQDAFGGRHHVSPEEGVTYAAVAAAAVAAAPDASQQTIGPLKPTAKGSDHPNTPFLTRWHKGSCRLTCPGE